MLLQTLAPCPALPPIPVGCINVVPGVWEPQWVPAELLLYGPPLERTITLVFHDEGEPFQHAIDLQGAEFLCIFDSMLPSRNETLHCSCPFAEFSF
jgi:hypothetical protein